ncbi:DNA alkylation repair enzyme [compost metagenome]
MTESIVNRKGASKPSLIPDQVLSLLHTGEIESVNLTEWLAVDHVSLLKHVLPNVNLQSYLQDVLPEVEQGNNNSGMKAIRIIGQKLQEILHTMNESEYSSTFHSLATHPSDSVRCWSAYIIGLNPTLSIDEKLAQIKRFAADPHFGVREIAWMAVRESMANELSASLLILQDWVKENDANVRRFATESIRPRGVWCKHIDLLKQEPELALPLLEQVKSDPAKYVQDSVGNWLNDASKSQPEWVVQICQQWAETSNTKETKRIITKAQRTLIQKG